MLDKYNRAQIKISSFRGLHKIYGVAGIETSRFAAATNPSGPSKTSSKATESSLSSSSLKLSCSSTVQQSLQNLTSVLLFNEILLKIFVLYAATASNFKENQRVVLPSLAGVPCRYSSMHLIGQLDSNLAIL